MAMQHAAHILNPRRFAVQRAYMTDPAVASQVPPVAPRVSTWLPQPASLNTPTPASAEINRDENLRVIALNQ